MFSFWIFPVLMDEDDLTGELVPPPANHAKRSLDDAEVSCDEPLDLSLKRPRFE